MSQLDKNLTVDIFSDLRERLYRISSSNQQFYVENQSQYEYLISTLTRDFFQNRLNISIDVLENLLNEVSIIKSKSKEWAKYIQLDDIQEDNPFVTPVFKDIKTKRSFTLKKRTKEVINELSFYEIHIQKLIDKGNELMSSDIDNAIGRLKFNIPISDVMYLLKLLSEEGIIANKTNKEISIFVANNFATTRDGFSIGNLAKLMSTPDSKTVDNLLITITKLQQKLIQKQKEISL